MRRRSFITNTLLAGLGTQLSAGGLLNGGLTRDAYGGWMERTYPATGYFRLEYDDRWWLVTPEGHAYLAFGINHVDRGDLSRSYNLDHWRRELGSEPEDDAWTDRFIDKARRDISEFGFNSFGFHGFFSGYDGPAAVPYIRRVEFVDLAHYRPHEPADFVDVFEDDFATYCDARAREVAEVCADDPYLLGYAFTDCPIFSVEAGELRHTTVEGAPRPASPLWPVVLWNLPADRAGKQRYVEMMRSRYGDDIRAFNRVYATYFDDFQELAAANRWRYRVDTGNTAMRADYDAWLAVIVDRYYRITTEALRRHDPNHLIFGDKLNGNTHTPPVVIEAANRYMDLIFYQLYAFAPEQELLLAGWRSYTGKPFFNGDASFAAPTAEMPDPYGPHVSDQQARAEASEAFARSAFGMEDFVGWTVCGWMDNWKYLPGKAIKQHAGIQDPFGSYHEPLRQRIRAVSEDLYDIATTKK